MQKTTFLRESEFNCNIKIKNTEFYRNSNREFNKTQIKRFRHSIVKMYLFSTFFVDELGYLFMQKGIAAVAFLMSEIAALTAFARNDVSNRFPVIARRA